MKKDILSLGLNYTMSISSPLTQQELNNLFSLSSNWHAQLFDLSLAHFNGLVHAFEGRAIRDFNELIADSTNMPDKFLKETTGLDENDKLLVLKGVEYFKQDVNPTKHEILSFILSSSIYSYFAGHMRDNINEYFNKTSSYYKDVTSRSNLERQVNYIINYVVQGFNIIKFELFLEKYFTIYKAEKPFFSTEIELNGSITGGRFKQLVNKIEKMQSYGIKADETISEVCNRNDLVKNLNDQFNQLVTPDRKRTIEDRVSEIEIKAGLKKNQSSDLINEGTSLNKYFREGYFYAIRGEAPKIIDLNSFERYSWYPNVNSDFKESIDEILKGYANAFHLKYLQDLLQDGTAATEKFIENTEPLLQLKWIGNNNQLYDVIRQLKKNNLLLNSYPELAYFLKRTVNKLDSTSLSTIQKELEKEKRPSKARRIDLDLDESPE